MLLAIFALTSLQAIRGQLAHAQSAERIPARIVLNTSGVEGQARNSATFTVQVTGADGKSADAAASMPTGSVSFMNGEHSIGAAFLDDQGRATLSVAALPPGEQKITAVYQGDDNFEAATSVPAAVTAEATGVPAFTLTASNSSISVVAGGTVSTVITATPQNGFNQGVSLSCSGIPYATTTCVFTPAQVTPGAPTEANPNGTAVISTLAIQTLASDGGELREPGFRRPGVAGHDDTFYAIAAPGLFALAGLGLAGRRWGQGKGKGRGSAKVIAILFLLVASGMGLSSCAQRYKYFHRPPQGNPGTPAGTYTVIITGTTGTGSSLSTANVQVTMVVKTS